MLWVSQTVERRNGQSAQSPPFDSLHGQVKIFGDRRGGSGGCPARWLLSVAACPGPVPPQERTDQAVGALMTAAVWPCVARPGDWRWHGPDFASPGWAAPGWLAPAGPGSKPWPREDDGKPGAAAGQIRASPGLPRPPTGPGPLAWLPGCQSVISRVRMQSAAISGRRLFYPVTRSASFRCARNRAGRPGETVIPACPGPDVPAAQRSDEWTGNHLSVESIRRCGG